MDVQNLTSALARIPRFVRHLNEYAMAHGVAVQVNVGPCEDDRLVPYPQPRVWSTWRTTVDRFFQLEIVTPGNKLPKTRKLYTVPSGCNYRPEDSLLAGFLTVSGRDVVWDIDCGPPVFEIEDLMGVEVVTYERQIVHFGTPEALIALGVESRHLPAGKYDYKHGDGHTFSQKHGWRSRRAPGGMIIYRVETDLAKQERIARGEQWHQMARLAQMAAADAERQLPARTSNTRPRPPWLRLVVDNARPISNL